MEFDTKLIKGNRFYLNKFVNVILAICFFIPVFILGNGRTDSIADEMNINPGYRVLLFIASGLFFLIWIVKLFSPISYVIGRLKIDAETVILELKNKEKHIFEISGLKQLSIETEEYNSKPKVYRKIGDGLNHNWIGIKSNDKVFRYEFELESLEKEASLIDMIENLKLKYSNIVLNKTERKKSFWEI